MHNCHLHTPALPGLLSSPQTGEALPGHAERAPPFQKAGASSDCACASSWAFAGAAGAWKSGTRWGARSREDAPVCLRALEPGLLSGNRRRTWEERVEHEEAGSLVRAEASADTVREGGCGRGRGGGGRPTSLPVEGRARRGFWPVD